MMMMMMMMIIVVVVVMMMMIYQPNICIVICEPERANCVGLILLYRNIIIVLLVVDEW